VAVNVINVQEFTGSLTASVCF